MIKLLLASISILVMFSCSKTKPVAILEPEPGCTITISAVTISKPERRVNGLLVIENSAAPFVKISNKELFMYSETDSVRTYTALKGKWQIDDGLINVMKDKKITLQVYWPLFPMIPVDALQFKYVKVLKRP